MTVLLRTSQTIGYIHTCDDRLSERDTSESGCSLYIVNQYSFTVVERLILDHSFAPLALLFVGCSWVWIEHCLVNKRWAFYFCTDFFPKSSITFWLKAFVRKCRQLRLSRMRTETGTWCKVDIATGTMESRVKWTDSDGGERGTQERNKRPIKKQFNGQSLIRFHPTPQRYSSPEQAPQNKEQQL